MQAAVESIEHAADWLTHRWSLAQAPETWMIVAIAAGTFAALCWPPAWRLLRHGTTVVHEMGHVLTGWAMGRRVRGIRLHSDASGLTLSSGRPRGPGMLMTCVAGYPAPALLGLGLIAASTAGYSGAALTAIVALLAVALLLVRNAFGLLVALTALAAAGAIFWQADPVLVTATTLAVGLLLALSAVRASLGLLRVRGQGSDADMAAEHSILPAMVWILLFNAVTLAAAGLAVPMALLGAR